MLKSSYIRLYLCSTLFIHTPGLKGILNHTTLYFFHISITILNFRLIHTITNKHTTLVSNRKWHNQGKSITTQWIYILVSFPGEETLNSFCTKTTLMLVYWFFFCCYYNIPNQSNSMRSLFWLAVKGCSGAWGDRCLLVLQAAENIELTVEK